jgi:uncharacterized protein
MMNIIAETLQKTENSFIESFNLHNSLPKITSFLIKVTARCNLNCDYCYVFNHADQSWKKMPAALSSENSEHLAKRISAYALTEKLDECLILFHGGEPLLIGVERLIEMARLIRKEIPLETKVYFSLQTNGTLLNKERLEALNKEGIGVSLSLDGPKEANDLHRLTLKGHSTFDKIINAYSLLKNYPKIFTGVIGVIDPRVPPRELLSFFSNLNPPQLDFLLPDANYITPPFLRETNQNIYIDWLIEAFNIWYDEYPTLNIRLFDNLIGVIAGLPSQTDAFGLGDVSLLTIETDGYYHDLDVLKITEEGFSSLDLHVKHHSIYEVISSHKIQDHRKLLSFEGLSEKCQNCSEVKICGGGSVPHRYDTNGFANPTIYCREMLSLISHIRRRLIESVSLDTQEKMAVSVAGFENLNVLTYEKAQFDNPELLKVYNAWNEKCVDNFLKCIEYVSEAFSPSIELKENFYNLPMDTLKRLSTRPSSILWVRVFEKYQKNQKLYDIEGKIVEPDVNYLNYIYECRFNKGIEIHQNDYFLRCTFGNSIIFEPEEIRQDGVELVQKAMAIIENLDPAIKSEIELLSPYFQFIKDPSAHPDKIVSFSDNAVPGALYLSIRKGEGYIDPYDLADSIIHEHRHQKLYLLEQFVPIIYSDLPLLPSPWRQELRPASGVYHGAFVFHQLKKYWELVSKSGRKDMQEKAKKQWDFCRTSLNEALVILKAASITKEGRKILEEFENLNAHPE